MMSPVEVLNPFCRNGAESGNVALKCSPYAGVYLAGGIGGKILLALKNGEFIKIFNKAAGNNGVLPNILFKKLFIAGGNCDSFLS